MLRQNRMEVWGKVKAGMTQNALEAQKQLDEITARREAVAEEVGLYIAVLAENKKAQEMEAQWRRKAELAAKRQEGKAGAGGKKKSEKAREKTKKRQNTQKKKRQTVTKRVSSRSKSALSSGSDSVSGGESDDDVSSGSSDNALVPAPSKSNDTWGLRDFNVGDGYCMVGANTSGDMEPWFARVSSVRRKKNKGIEVVFMEPKTQGKYVGEWVDSVYAKSQALWKKNITLKQLDALTCCVFAWQDGLDCKIMSDKEWKECEICVDECKNQYGSDSSDE